MSGFVPYFSYRDAAAAIEWLEETFAFEKVQAYSGPDGEIIHAEMRFGDGALMLGSGEPPARQATQAETASPTAHGVYVVVDDVDGHYERARSAGAMIVYGPEDTEFGTRRYRALDPEGYEWSFGSYDPGGAG